MWPDARTVGVVHAVLLAIGLAAVGARDTVRGTHDGFADQPTALFVLAFFMGANNECCQEVCKLQVIT